MAGGAGLELARDAEAVADALEENRLGGYAADVFAMEDWALPGHPAEIPQGCCAIPEPCSPRTSARRSPAPAGRCRLPPRDKSGRLSAASDPTTP